MHDADSSNNWQQQHGSYRVHVMLPEAGRQRWGSLLYADFTDSKVADGEGKDLACSWATATDHADDYIVHPMQCHRGCSTGCRSEPMRVALSS